MEQRKHKIHSTCQKSHHEIFSIMNPSNFIVLKYRYKQVHSTYIYSTLLTVFFTTSLRASSFTSFKTDLVLDCKSTVKEVNDCSPTYPTQYCSIFLNRKLLWCPVYKAASSTWMNIIPRLTNYKFSQIKMMEQIHIQANDLIKAILPPLNYVKLGAQSFYFFGIRSQQWNISLKELLC